MACLGQVAGAAPHNCRHITVDFGIVGVVEGVVGFAHTHGLAVLGIRVERVGAAGKVGGFKAALVEIWVFGWESIVDNVFLLDEGIDDVILEGVHD